MPQFTAIATCALWKLNMPSNAPASERAQSWTSETMLLLALTFSTNSRIPATLIARARSWPPRRRSTAFTTRRCAGAAREDELAGVEQTQARVARKCRRPGYEARCCAIWEKRVRLGHWDLRIALRGRNLSEVRSCCRSEDRPHIDALGHRLYSVSGDEQPATDRAARVPACGVRRRGPPRLTGPASRGRRRGRWDRG